jgi:hypothetical protein
MQCASAERAEARRVTSENFMMSLVSTLGYDGMPGCRDQNIQHPAAVDARYLYTPSLADG